ncbi:hypothetical protein LTR94_036346, partial [Friedmanniomyces endolithicus]
DRVLAGARGGRPGAAGPVRPRRRLGTRQQGERDRQGQGRALPRAGLCLRFDRLPAGAAGDGGTTGERCRRRTGGAAGASRCAGDRPAPRGADGPQRRGAPCGA